MSTTWYRVVGIYGCCIEAIEVTKETKHYLICGRIRQKKNTDYATSFPTREEALAYARERTQTEIERLKRSIQEWEDSLKELETDAA